MMLAGGISGASPTDAQVIEAVNAIRENHGDRIGHAKLRAILKQENEWAISEARLKKLLQGLDLESTPPSDAQVIEAVNAIRNQQGHKLGHAKLRAKLKENNDWAISEARLKKLVPAVNQLENGPIAPSDAQVLVALDNVRKEYEDGLAFGKLRSLLKERNNWAISEARLKRLFQQHRDSIAQSITGEEATPSRVIFYSPSDSVMSSLKDSSSAPALRLDYDGLVTSLSRPGNAEMLSTSDPIYAFVSSYLRGHQQEIAFSDYEVRMLCRAMMEAEIDVAVGCATPLYSRQTDKLVHLGCALLHMMVESTSNRPASHPALGSRVNLIPGVHLGDGHYIRQFVHFQCKNNHEANHHKGYIVFCFQVPPAYRTVQSVRCERLQTFQPLGTIMLELKCGHVVHAGDTFLRLHTMDSVGAMRCPVPRCPGGSAIWEMF